MPSGLRYIDKQDGEQYSHKVVVVGYKKEVSDSGCNIAIKFLNGKFLLKNA